MESNQQLSKSSNERSILEALAQMALMRGAGPSPQTFKAYSRRLAREQLEDVLSAIITLSELPRGEGDLAFPEIGMILSTVGIARVARHNREANSQPVDLVRWRCPECHHATADFIAPDDAGYRRCRGIPRDGKFDQNYQGEKICGAMMDIAKRIPNYKSDAPWTVTE
jgi:hypothetical protein